MNREVNMGWFGQQVEEYGRIIDIMDTEYDELAEKCNQLECQNTDLSEANKQMHVDLMRYADVVEENEALKDELGTEKERVAVLNKDIYELQRERDSLQGSIRSLKGEITKLNGGKL